MTRRRTPARYAVNRALNVADLARIDARELAAHEAHISDALAREFVFACSPRGAHVHTSACVIRRAHSGPRCVYCGEMTVATDLGRAHMVSGAYWCAGSRTTSATVAP